MSAAFGEVTVIVTGVTPASDTTTILPLPTLNLTGTFFLIQSALAPSSAIWTLLPSIERILPVVGAAAGNADDTPNATSTSTTANAMCLIMSPFSVSYTHLTLPT